MFVLQTTNKTAQKLRHYAYKSCLHSAQLCYWETGILEREKLGASLCLSLS